MVELVLAVVTHAPPIETDALAEVRPGDTPRANIA